MWCDGVVGVEQHVMSLTYTIDPPTSNRIKFSSVYVIIVTLPWSDTLRPSNIVVNVAILGAHLYFFLLLAVLSLIELIWKICLMRNYNVIGTCVIVSCLFSMLINIFLDIINARVVVASLDLSWCKSIVVNIFVPDSFLASYLSRILICSIRVIVS